MKKSYKEPDQEKLNEIIPEPKKGRILKTSVKEHVIEQRKKLLEGLATYTLKYPTRRTYKKLSQQLKRLKNDPDKYTIVKAGIEKINKFYEDPDDLESQKWMKALSLHKRGPKPKHQHIYSSVLQNWDKEKKEYLLKKYGSGRAATDHILKDLAKKFPDEKLPSNTTLREVLGFKKK